MLQRRPTPCRHGPFGVVVLSQGRPRRAPTHSLGAQSSKRVCGHAAQLGARVGELSADPPGPLKSGFAEAFQKTLGAGAPPARLRDKPGADFDPTFAMILSKACPVTASFRAMFANLIAQSFHIRVQTEKLGPHLVAEAPANEVPPVPKIVEFASNNRSPGFVVRTEGGEGGAPGVGLLGSDHRGRAPLLRSLLDPQKDRAGIGVTWHVA